MCADRKQDRTWLFYATPGFSRLKLQFICGSLRHEAAFKYLPELRGIVAVSGTAFEKRFELEARKTGEAPIPDFDGRFEVSDGPSGKFEIARGPKGQLMSLGVYGTRPAIRLFMVSPSHVKSPLVLEGLAGCDAVFEDIESSRYFRMPGRPKLPRRPSRLTYAGWCAASQQANEMLPPYAAVLTVLLVCYVSLLLPYYLDAG